VAQTIIQRPGAAADSVLYLLLASPWRFSALF
jgi:hypothetical protein